MSVLPQVFLPKKAGTLPASTDVRNHHKRRDAVKRQWTTCLAILALLSKVRCIRARQLEVCDDLLDRRIIALSFLFPNVVKSREITLLPSRLSPPDVRDAEVGGR